MNMDQSRDGPLWSGIAFRVLTNTVSYPTQYAKVLIQIGHEPIPPRPTTTIFRQPALALPNVFEYVRYIKKVDGFTGCYRGLVPKLCAATISAIAVDKTTKYIEKHANQKSKDNEHQETEEEGTSWEKFVFEMIRDLISKLVGVIASHPFHVVSLRMMAQFVGRETKYSDMLSSFAEIYKQDGIAGYYAGVVPRCIGNASLVILSCSSIYVLNRYVITDPELRNYAAATVKFVAATITYPYLVVSHCMSVNNCGLAAGLPPHMPIYRGWWDCWSHLSETNQLKRGSSLLWRYYKGPQIIMDGKPVPIPEHNFYPKSKMQ